MLGDVKFLREIDAAQAAWKLERDDLRLSPQSPLGDIGPGRQPDSSASRPRQSLTIRVPRRAQSEARGRRRRQSPRSWRISVSSS